MNKYFENIRTLEELRKQYKELLKLHHPDNGCSSFISKSTAASLYFQKRNRYKIKKY